MTLACGAQAGSVQPLAVSAIPANMMPLGALVASATARCAARLCSARGKQEGSPCTWQRKREAHVLAPRTLAPKRRCAACLRNVSARAERKLTGAASGSAKVDIIGIFVRLALALILKWGLGVEIFSGRVSGDVRTRRQHVRRHFRCSTCKAVLSVMSVMCPSCPSCVR